MYCYLHLKIIKVLAENGEQPNLELVEFPLDK